MRAMRKRDERYVPPRSERVVFCDEVVAIPAAAQTPAYQLAGAGVEAGLVVHRPLQAAEV